MNAARRTSTIPCIFTLVLGIVLIMTGCNYLNISREDDVLSGGVLNHGGKDLSTYNSAVIKGTVIDSDRGKNPTLLVAYSPADKDAEFVDYVFLDKAKPFMLYLPAGHYYLYAVEDLDMDGIYRDSEVTGVYGSRQSPQEIVVREG
ncbi:MAG: hypothetical protein PHN75_17460, partial [Syntrophales bacterium]|nr:hypothetical protein [Syntrophales bacterium]